MSRQFDVVEPILSVGHSSPSRQPVSFADNPLMEVISAATQSTHTAPASVSPFLPRFASAHRSSPAHYSLSQHDQSTSAAETSTIQRTARMSVRPSDQTIRLSSLISPHLRSRYGYTDTSTPVDSPVSSPDCSPPRQRLRRSVSSYSDEDEDPMEDPMEDPAVDSVQVQVETAPVEPTAGDMQIDGELWRDVPSNGKGVMEDVQGVFEIGQSSRDAQVQSSGVAQWVDIPCVTVQAASPEYTPSTPPFVPPTSPIPSPPSSQAVSLHPDSPDMGEELTAIQEIHVQLANQDLLLEVHSDQIQRLEQSDRLQRIERRVGTIDRAACVLFEELYGDRRERVGLQARFEAFERMHGRELGVLGAQVRDLRSGHHQTYRMPGRARGSERAQWQRIETAEYMIGAVMAENAELRLRVTHLEAAIGGMTAAFDRMRAERDRS